MFENNVISYELKGDICVITYKKNVFIDADASESIVAEKERLQEVTTIRKFIGVIHSSVSIDKKTMFKFSTKKALQNVDFIGVVFIHDKRIGRFLYSKGCGLLNFMVLISLKKNNIRFFNNEKKAINWIEKLYL